MIAALVDDTRAACLAGGGSASDCDRLIADRIVDGVYCDGNVLLVAGQPKRCVPAAVVNAKLEIEATDPLPPPPSVKAGNVYVWIGAIVLVAGLAWYAASRE